MTDNELNNLKYPIGKFLKPDTITPAHITSWMATIEALPAQLKALTGDLSSQKFAYTYRPEGWTITQVTNHLADSHMNAFIRFKLALTEENPTIRPYHEDFWAKLPDGTMPAQVSINLIEALHARWAVLLKALSTDDLERTFYHPERKTEITLAHNIGLYAWHGNHHLAHIKQALKNA